jgi:hypothetical protein
VEWAEVVSWTAGALKGKGPQASLCKLCLAAVVYHIWRQRNDLCHGNVPKTEEALVATIKWEVRLRFMAKSAGKKTALNVDLVHQWNLHCQLA